jgi:hypothetical protein
VTDKIAATHKQVSVLYRTRRLKITAMLSSAYASCQASERTHLGTSCKKKTLQKHVIVCQWQLHISCAVELTLDRTIVNESNCLSMTTAHLVCSWANIWQTIVKAYDCLSMTTAHLVYSWAHTWQTIEGIYNCVSMTTAHEMRIWASTWQNSREAWCVVTVCTTYHWLHH